MKYLLILIVLLAGCSLIEQDEQGRIPALDTLWVAKGGEHRQRTSQPLRLADRGCTGDVDGCCDCLRNSEAETVDYQDQEVHRAQAGS